MEDKSTDELAKILWEFHTLKQELKHADTIFVLGNDDLRGARYGAELFLEGYAPLIIFSGNEGKFTKELWNKPEAEIFADEAMKMGVPKEAILIENRSTNTGENITYTKELLEQQKISLHSFILVQKPYMLRRAFATFKKQWPEKEVIVTSANISYEEYPHGTISKEAVISMLVGNIQRLQLYSEKGFIIPVDIPEPVLLAYQELIKRGYTNGLIDQ